MARYPSLPALRLTVGPRLPGVIDAEAKWIFTHRLLELRYWVIQSHAPCRGLRTGCFGLLND